MPKFYKKILDLRNMYLIKNSGYFDKDYYKKEYPDVKGNLLKHYYYEGYKLGNNPSEKFYNNYYLEHNVDIKNCGINPLLHYVISGKKEGREIRQYLGMSIADLYYHLYQKNYSCNTYLKNTENKRITLFLGNELTDDLVQLVITLINLCKKNKMMFRIVYKNFEMNRLLSELKKQQIEDFGNLSFLKWNQKYLLEMFYNEKFICSDFSTLYTLVNTKMISGSIYYYITNNLDLNEEEQMILSSLVQSKKVVCVGDSKLYQYQLKVEDNLKKVSKKSYKLCFDFGDMSVFMLQVYNDFFLNSCCLQNLKFYYKNEHVYQNICFDNNIPIQCLSNMDDIDIVVRFNYKKTCLLNEESWINIYFEKTNQMIEKIKVEDIILNNDNDIQKKFAIELEKTFKKIGIGDRDV